MSDSESEQIESASDYDEDDSPRPAAKPKKSAAPAPLQPSTKANVPAARTIEETYQKKTQLEHILLRPDTYIGSVQMHSSSLWVYEGGQMVNKEISYVPGLYKIFDEILVNAADNKQRDQSMTSVKVNIDPEKNTIQVWNNGKGVPVEMHAKEKVYVPELIFGHLLTSSNYDDTEKKTTGGRNGFGAKLANIYSTEFIVETCDGERGKHYKQVYKNNMSIKGEPQISKCRKSDNWTSITFKPDLVKFKMEQLDSDIVALMSKRVVDIAGCLGKTVKVELNGSVIPVKTFVDYVGLYLDSSKHPDKDEPLPKVYEKVNDRWEICVSVTDGQFQQVSFVNSIATIKGGTHVSLVTDQVAKFLLAKAQKKLGKNAAALKLAAVKNHLWVFVNALIENPAFDSQTKETLNTRVSDFGSTCKLGEDLLKKIATKTGIVDSLVAFATFKSNKGMKKTDGSKKQRLTGISKLDDANDAGGKNSEECTLILTEGDSAKALAISGLSVVGRNKYGVFPLRGKLLNVRDATPKQITENAEITHIKQIMGLQQGKHYDSTKGLRYGHLMIMTDQDHDGSHIKGLIINFLHTFWPSLLKQPNFLLEFITPIVKATHKKKGQVLSFYTMPEYESWKEQLGTGSKGWSIKYYKGLGTSTPKEAKEYFAALDRHRIGFRWGGDQDNEHIELAFSKKKVEDRKSWLRNFEPGTYLDQDVDEITYSEFVNKELVLFSMADNVRSIPSMMDGFKPGQRKILFSCFKRKLKKDVKVAQLAGYVSEHSAYHHGEASLQGTIVGLAQDFVGSNNINLLMPSGQFGTRLQGGKDAASSRYIYTRLHTLTRMLFPETDDPLLDFLNEDGQKIEPQWYLPILPMVLVNGADGIGTGWSTTVPTYSPRDIVDNIKRLMRGEVLKTMQPWFKGFRGTVSPGKTEDGKVTSFTITGIIEKKSENVLEITELPVGKWTQDYKEFLEKEFMAPQKGGEPLVQDMKEFHTDTTVHFELHLAPGAMSALEAEGLLKKFKLSSSISTTNMHLFDKDGRIARYDSPEHILESFYGVRLEYYSKRKASMVDVQSYTLERIDNRVRFILAVIKGEIIVSNRKKLELLEELKAKGYPKMLTKDGPPKNPNYFDDASSDDEQDGGDEGEEEEEDAEAEEGEGDGEKIKKKKKESGYEYLLGMPLWSLTMERVQRLLNEQERRRTELEILKATTPQQLWEFDLDRFLDELEKVEIAEAEEKANSGKIKPKKGQAKKAAPKRTAKKGKNIESDEDVMDIESDDSDFEAPKGRGKKLSNRKATKAAPKASAPKAPGGKPSNKPPALAVKPERPSTASLAKASAKGGQNPADASDYDSEDEFGGSLMERLGVKSTVPSQDGEAMDADEDPTTDNVATGLREPGGSETDIGDGLKGEDTSPMEFESRGKGRAVGSKEGKVKGRKKKADELNSDDGEGAGVEKAGQEKEATAPPAKGKAATKGKGAPKGKEVKAKAGRRKKADVEEDSPSDKTKGKGARKRKTPSPKRKEEFDFSDTEDEKSAGGKQRKVVAMPEPEKGDQSSKSTRPARNAQKKASYKQDSDSDGGNESEGSEYVSASDDE